MALNIIFNLSYVHIYCKIALSAFKFRIVLNQNKAWPTSARTFWLWNTVAFGKEAQHCHSARQARPVQGPSAGKATGLWDEERIQETTDSLTSLQGSRSGGYKRESPQEKETSESYRLTGRRAGQGPRRIHTKEATWPNLCSVYRACTSNAISPSFHCNFHIALSSFFISFLHIGVSVVPPHFSGCDIFARLNRSVQRV